MDDMLYKIDEIRKRTNVTYETAKLALERASGDVVEALVELERASANREIIKVKGPDLVRAVSSIIRRGNASRIIVRSGDYVVADIPVTIGVAAAVLAPWLALLSSVALLMSTWTVEIERPFDENGL
ncbi:MAG TPA: DUF4342 domain-containing protein [Firmicutes bacterium]|nr:DUF4342 domain-containing protein [Candidatus Fermentithermobacillaceae bacterium]